MMALDTTSKQMKDLGKEIPSPISFDIVDDMLSIFNRENKGCGQIRVILYLLDDGLFILRDLRHQSLQVKLSQVWPKLIEKKTIILTTST